VQKLRKLLGGLLNAYLVVAALLVAALGGTAFVLWRQGILDADTLAKLGKVVRHQPVGDQVIVYRPPETFAVEVAWMKEKADVEIARRQRNLEAQEQQFELVRKKLLDDAAAALSNRAAQVDAREKEFDAQIADREAAVRADEVVRSSKNFKLDIDLLSRLDPADAAKQIIDMSNGGHPDRALLLMRSLKSRVAGDVFQELVKQDAKLATDLQQRLTEGPGLSPSETKRLASLLAAWDDLEDLVALLRQVAPPERENLVREIVAANPSIADKLRARLDVAK